MSNNTGTTYNEADEKYVEINSTLSEPGYYSKRYLEWISEVNSGCTEPLMLTNSQHRFAEFLFSNEDKISGPGKLEPIFKSIRKFIKHGKNKIQKGKR